MSARALSTTSCRTVVRLRFALTRRVAAAERSQRLDLLPTVLASFNLPLPLNDSVPDFVTFIWRCR